MAYRERINQKLTDQFAPEYLMIRDDSAKHAGHAGASPEGETHFYVEIRAKAFDGLSRVARQRLVYQALSDELAEHVHALALKVDGVD